MNSNHLQIKCGLYSKYIKIEYVEKIKGFIVQFFSYKTVFSGMKTSVRNGVILQLFVFWFYNLYKGS